MDLPSVEELDAVALFVITARELRSCRFFIEEHRQLRIQWRAGDSDEDVSGEFPDPDTVAAALIPFRKLWMSREACNYRRVANIIKRYCPELRWRVDSALAMNCPRPKLMPFARIAALSSEDVIDLWLNTRHMHVGVPGEGRFSREDFERWEKQLGSTLFEYHFLLSLGQFGILFFNLLRDAEAFLNWCHSQDLSPKVNVAQPPLNPKVSRHTPGFDPQREHGEEMVWRLLRRRKYESFADVIDRLDVSDAVAASLVTECRDFSELCHKLGIRIRRVDDFGSASTDDWLFVGAATDDYATPQSGRARSGMWTMKKTGELLWEGDWLELVSEQFTAFRETLLGN